MKIISLNIRGLGIEDKDKLKLNWFRKLCNRENPNFIALQETKCQDFPEFWIKMFWGNSEYKYTCKKSRGNSGGLLLVWDPSLFKANHIIERDSFIAVKGLWKSAGTELILINTYGPHTDEGKKKMWSDLCDVMNYDDAMWVIFGDFNEVRFASERKKLQFHRKKSRTFQRLHQKNVLLQWPNINAVVLDKKYTDHCPIMLRDGNIDFGPKPVKVFDDWIKRCA
ncbi:uncharacterized protein [Rutidosis leptorrhynchoides]|uniref:uncharacterized protein n=1 Tax=Rutidosis leptorrhynchoides TaxID=125765 RepID=UPI003A99FC67